MLKFFKNIGLFLIFIIGFNINAQNLEDHQWKNRLLIIQTNQESSILFQNQQKEFKNSNTAFKDRKLVLYTVVNNKYQKTEFHKNKTTTSKWIAVDSLFQKLLNKKEYFRLLLIGLDGGIKLDQNSILKKEQLFNTIDAMPMRAAELEK